jgi:hypothetical protein
MINMYILKLKLNLKMAIYYLEGLPLDRQKKKRKKRCRSVFSLTSYLYSTLTLIHPLFEPSEKEKKVVLFNKYKGHK